MPVKLPFEYEPFIIGVVHVGPLPGSSSFRGRLKALIDEALRNARALEDGGVDGIIVENFYDKPFPKNRADPATVASIALIVREVSRAVGVPVGVNILRNCWMDSVAVAYVAGGRYVRVNALVEAVSTPEGVIEPAAYGLRRYMRFLGAEGIAVLADVHVKHGRPIAARPLGDVAVEAVERGLADAVVVSGELTGAEARIDDVREVRDRLGGAVPVVVGSGVNPGNAPRFLSIANGAIVGTYFKVGREVSVDRVRRLVSSVKHLRRRTS